MKKYTVAKLAQKAAIATSVLFAGRSFAAVASIPNSGVSTAQELVNVLCNVFTWMFWFMLAISVLMVMWASYNYITAQDDAEKTAKANRTLTYVAIGVAVALLAKAMPLIVQDFFGVTGATNGCTSTGSSVPVNPPATGNGVI